MCFNACPYFNRFTELSSCQRNGDGLLPCELEEGDEGEKEAALTRLLIHLSPSFTPEEREAALNRAATNNHEEGREWT